ncbi:MAG: ThuA domain-containing protein [Pirellulales bacterium]|nr:ThuA domain-containing protein [Pirellulales bacterium]
MSKYFYAMVLFGVVYCYGFVEAAQPPHAVLVVGTHHYAPQTTMPFLATELERLGFRTTVVNPAWDPEKDKRGLPGLEVLKDADVGIFFMRFLQLKDSQLAHITEFIESGKAVVGLRTSTHAFNYPKNHPRHALNNDFGQKVLGSPYLIHLAGKTQVKPAANALHHPILTGVDTTGWESSGTLYLINAQPGIEPLLIGTGHSKRVGTVTNQFGIHELEQTMSAPIAWTWKNSYGNRVFTTSLGHAKDFTNKNALRVIVNGVFWSVNRSVLSAETVLNTFSTAAK